MIFFYDAGAKTLVFPDDKVEGKMRAISTKALRTFGWKGCEDANLLRSLPDPRGPKIVSPMQALAEMQQRRR